MSNTDEMFITITDDGLSEKVVAEITRTMKQDISRRLRVETENLTSDEMDEQGTKGLKQVWDKFKVLITSKVVQDKASDIFNVVLKRYERTASITVKLKMPSGAEFEFNAENMTPAEIEKTKAEFLALWKDQG